MRCMKSCKKSPGKKLSTKVAAKPKVKGLAQSFPPLTVASYANGNLWAGLPYRRVIE